MKTTNLEPNFFELPIEEQTKIMMEAIRKSNQVQQAMHEEAEKIRELGGAE